ncbi:ABC transporter permease [Sphaerimonospora thailandensis]|uniref:Peptide ABC transporter permease n=1 Tax=Sphaerimonospora thailandensis TaxID=795644 RepID=A0A8J3R7P1_9ACTN|nr:ABC transporter permease [Sphaerimonospora thailandensis]GIH70841.1 peptide ABC transporter permease [Sphaerimonospora thailandensis]
MTRKLLLRLGELVVVLALVSFGVFLLVALIPGDPAVAILGEGHPPEDYAALRAELGLDQPILNRYLDWLGGALTGDLGHSIVPPRSAVIDRVLAALPVSAELAILGLLLAMALAIPLAMWSAAREGGLVDRAIGASTFAVLSVPSFLSGLLLIMVLVNGLGWFPRGQWVRVSESITGNLHHALLPAVVIALSEAAVFTRILRSDLVVTLREDFVLAARARGMPRWRVLVGDALRPSSFSLLTLLGLSFGSLIGSTVIVETLFALPGMGSLVVNAANQGDFPMVQGATLLIAAAYVLVNIGIDLAYGFLDPRTRRVHA